MLQSNSYLLTESDKNAKLNWWKQCREDQSFDRKFLDMSEDFFSPHSVVEFNCGYSFVLVSYQFEASRYCLRLPSIAKLFHYMLRFHAFESKICVDCVIKNVGQSHLWPYQIKWFNIIASNISIRTSVTELCLA